MAVTAWQLHDRLHCLIINHRPYPSLCQFYRIITKKCGYIQDTQLNLGLSPGSLYAHLFFITIINVNVKLISLKTNRRPTFKFINRRQSFH